MPLCKLTAINVSSLADLTDIDIIKEDPDPSIFPGIASGTQIHNGFASEQARYATHVNHN